MSHIASPGARRLGDLPRDLLLRFLRAEWSGAVIAILVLALAIEAVTEGRSFFHPTNLMTILNNAAALGIVAGGMTLVILTAGIDLSVGSVMGMTAALMGYLVSYMGVDPLTAIACGMAVGFIQGGLVAWFGMPAFIVTLAGLSVWRGTGHLATGAQATPRLPETFDTFGRWNPFEPLRAAYQAGELSPLWTPVGAFVDANWVNFFRTVQMSAILFVGFFVLLAIVTANTRFGRYVYAIGSNPAGARQAGIPTARYIVMVYMVSSVCAVLGALLFMGRAPYAKSDYGLMWELEAIAAVVIGGTSLFGGRGSVWGTFAGVILLKLINNGLTLAQLNTFWQMVVTGIIIVLAVALDIVRQARDAMLVKRFLAALAAAMAVLTLMTPASLWVRAAVALTEHRAMQAMQAEGAALAPAQAQRIMAPGAVEEAQAVLAATALPSAVLLAVVLLALAAVVRPDRLVTAVAVAGLAGALALVLAAGYAPAAPFAVLGIVALVTQLLVNPLGRSAR
jgi:ribose/xylose/arabinose/galactoside ABC-type transport system permease subunit